MPEQVDLLVVGGGPGGYVAAARAAQLGREVLLVDRGGREGGLGGACLHVGCIPSKALIELAGAYERTTTMAAAGLRVADAHVDLGAFQSWKASIVDGLVQGVESLLSQTHVRHLSGQARFARRDRVAIELPDGGGSFVEFNDAIIATGSRPSTLAALPCDGQRVLSSTDALALEHVPETLAVVGGGSVGLEIGTAMAKLGSRVTVVEALDRLLPMLDQSLTKPLTRSLGRLGVELRLGARAIGLDGEDLVIEAGGATERIPAAQIIVAVGRRPNTEELGLDALDIAPDAHGLLAVDERCLLTPHVAAIGDVTAGPALAHKASAEGIVAAEALCGLPAVFDPRVIPMIVFTDPEIASVGLSEADARAAGLDVEVATAPLAVNGRARTLMAEHGFTRVVVDRASDRVVGVHVVGPHASELIAEGALAVEMLASPYDILGTIHAHPTLSEGMHVAVERIAAAATAKPVPA